MTIIPFIPDLQEQVNNIDNSSTSTITKLGRCFLFDFNKNEFVIRDGKLVECTEAEAVEQWITLIIQTYKDKFNIYKGTDFYCNIEDLVRQKPNGFIFSELKREITEALLKHRYIKNVDNFEFSSDNGKKVVSFTVILNDNTVLNREEEI